MALTYNDLRTKGLKYATAGADITSGGACRVMGILVSGGAGAGSVQVYNATATSGTDVIQVNVLANDSTYVSFAPNGVYFDTGLSLEETGTPDDGVVFYIAE